MLCLFVVLVGGAATAFARHATAFLPVEDQGYLIVVGRLPPGAAQPRVRELAATVDQVLASVPGIKGWVTSGGYSALDAATRANALTEYVMYEDWDRRPRGFSQDALVDELRRKLGEIRQAEFTVQVPPPIPGLGQSGGFQMVVEDRAAAGPRALRQATEGVLAAARRDPRLDAVTTTFSADSPQLYLDIDRTMVESLGVTINDVFQTLETYLGSTYVNQFDKFNQSFQVRVQADALHRRSLADLSNLYVANRSGQMVPLGALVTPRPLLGSDLITRYQLYPSATVIGGAAPGYSSGEALERMQRIADESLPSGMGYDWTGLSYQEKLIGNQAYFIFALSISLVFLVLAGQYESWTDPAAVILTVPIALVGIVVALVVRGYPVDLYTQIGLVLMIALAAKNAILVVEFAKELTAGGMPAAEAAIEATRRRFRPIVMTSLAFILGVVPLLTAHGAGAASQRALGTVVFGGMLASTLVAIPFVPGFYVVMQRFAERRLARKRLGAAAPVRPPVESAEAG
jgi:HAE1 family hydrophobic/amphiphilic exporter-1